MYDEFYNQHYIKIDEQGRIVEGFSNGPHPKKDATKAICINEKGGYQFKLFPNGEENPMLFDNNGIPLYKWEENQVKIRTANEIQKDTAKLPLIPPSVQEQLRADVDFIALMMGVML